MPSAFVMFITWLKFKFYVADFFDFRLLIEDIKEADSCKRYVFGGGV